ncbi:hypothetical protein MLD38_040033 [Melastoma candidum]|uniref:Uncharacterized protein n=1 Tax=Melastoma candidum TaxID=119954 RepID=A0ACB9L567_9MYRT|nr:hypothetical protein MLD38_040033 [Melastoma candidum]
MSATAAATPSCYHRSDNNQRRTRTHCRGGVCSSVVVAIRVNPLSKPTAIASSGSLLFGDVLLTRPRRDLAAPDGSSRRGRPTCPVMEWQDCTVKMEVGVPASVAYRLYSDRESIPRWMPFISAVKVMEDKPDLSRWYLKNIVFGIDIEYSWIAQNMQPIPDQKIHWRSLEGLKNRGAVRFYPRGASACLIELTASYEVPPLLVPVASALQPFMEGLLRQCLERFATLAKSKSI